MVVQKKKKKLPLNLGSLSFMKMVKLKTDYEFYVICKIPLKLARKFCKMAVRLSIVYGSECSGVVKHHI